MDPLRHLLATIAYRFMSAVRDAGTAFGRFDPGYGVRSPCAIVCHMTAVLRHAERAVSDVPHVAPEHLGWDQEVARFHRELIQLDRALQVRHPTREQALRLMQGPLADILTHVGQLAMLRRFAGSSVPGENFYVAPIEAGRLGPNENGEQHPMDD